MVIHRTKNNLYKTKSFWLIRKWLSEKPFFSFWKAIFRGNYQINRGKTLTGILWPTIPPFFATLVYVIFIIAIFESFNYLFPIKFNFDSEAIDALLTTIASISGVFLGLYFAAISAIAGNLLVRATQDVRRFFTLGPRTEQYVRTVALTGIISVLYLVAKSFGHDIHPFGLMFLAIVASYIIIRFWHISSDVFNALEPRDSFPWITKNIADSVKGATPPGFQWKRPYIQNHNRAVAAYNVELLNNLIDFGIKELKLSDRQLIIALQYLGGLLFFYSEEKSKIPTTSFWYKTKNQYESWTLADSAQIAMALNTGTTLYPKTIKDFTWFEEDVLDIGLKVLNLFIKEKKIGSAFQGLEVFVDVAENYGADFNEQGIKMLFQKLEQTTDSVYSIKVDDIRQQATKEQLAFIDTQGRLAIAALLGLAKYIDKTSCDDLSKTMSNIKWTSEKGDIYITGLPSAILPRLESISNDLQNEKIIEGKILSPEWYIKTLCFQQYLYSIQKYFNFLKSLHQDFFQTKLNSLLEKKQFPLAAQLVQRWLEFSNKYKRLVGLLKKHVETCEQFHQLKDLPRASFDFNTEEKIAIDRDKEITDRMIRLLPKLKTIVIDEELPDYFGQALTMGLVACYRACEENEHERFKKIMPIVFDASLTAFDLIREKVKNWSQEDSKIIYSSEPLINLLEISGYSKLYSELHQNPELWDVTKQLWDIYLNAVDAKQVISFIANVSSFRDSLFMIMPQENLRSSWNIDFENKMRERGFRIFPDTRDGENPDHPSPIIRILAKWGGIRMMTSAKNIFFVTYLSKHPEAAGVDFPDKRDLGKQIEEEEQGENNDQEDEY